MKAKNVSKGTLVAVDLKEATVFFSRLRGLIGRTGLKDGEGLWMARCRAIHTVGMRFPIDVVFLDENLIVKKVTKGVRPFRSVIYCSGAAGVIELPEGVIEKAQIQVGDRIELRMKD